MFGQKNWVNLLRAFFFEFSENQFFLTQCLPLYFSFFPRPIFFTGFGSTLSISMISPLFWGIALRIISLISGPIGFIAFGFNLDFATVFLLFSALSVLREAPDFLLVPHRVNFFLAEIINLGLGVNKNLE